MSDSNGSQLNDPRIGTIGKASEFVARKRMGSDVHPTGQVSVLVAAYNEEKTIGHVLLQLLDLSDIELKEVIVVDDGSRDRTAEIVTEISAGDSRVRLVRQPRNLGKTAAIAGAIAAATGDILVVQDADLEYDPAEISAIIAPILSGHADVVYGSRFMVRRAARVIYFHHYLGNRLITFLSDVLTNRNMTDIETGYKAFRAGLIKPLRLTSKGFGMEVEITAMLCKTRERTKCRSPIMGARTRKERKLGSGTE